MGIVLLQNVLTNTRSMVTLRHDVGGQIGNLTIIVSNIRSISCFVHAANFVWHSSK